MGLRTVEQLHLSGVPVVVVDDDPDLRLARIVESWGVPHIHRSAHLGDGLAEAGLDRALAVICAETNELATLEIALRVREARPDVRLVVQLANPSVGRALERVTGPGSVLDVAALAAPSFVEVCLGQPTHELELGGETLRRGPGHGGRRRGLPPDVPESLRQPRPRGRGAGRRRPRWPAVRAATIPVAAGDRVAVLGTPDELEPVGHRRGPRRCRRARRRYR